jgi:8-oxo-dGTP pyrophosphatase MutT (NUDIX family)
MNVREPAHSQLPLFADRSLEQKIEFLHTLVEDMYGIYFFGARRRILEILDRYACADDDEEGRIRRIRDLVEQVPNIFCKNCEIGHITGSALIVDLQRESFLLHYHKRLGKWLQFGGHCGFGDHGFETNPADVALREAGEETGIGGLEHLTRYIAEDTATSEQGDLREGEEASRIDPVDIDIHDVCSGKGTPGHVHLDFRYILAVPDANPVIQPQEGESNQFAWIEFRTFQLYQDKVDRSLRRFIKKAERLIRRENFRRC